MLKKYKISLISLIFFGFTLTSCTTRNESYYVRRGEEIKYQLFIELEGVNTLQDLFARQESLTILFEELSKVAIEARLYQLKSKKIWTLSDEASSSSQKLATQIGRVLEIPGARAFLEKCQSRGFEKVDAFEKTKERSFLKFK